MTDRVRRNSQQAEPAWAAISADAQNIPLRGKITVSYAVPLA